MMCVVSRCPLQRGGGGVRCKEMSIVESFRCKEVTGVRICPVYGAVRCKEVSVVESCQLLGGVRCLEVSVFGMRAL